MTYRGFRNSGGWQLTYLVLIVRNHAMLNYNERLQIRTSYTNSFLKGWHDELLTAKDARHISDGRCFFPRSGQQ